MGPSTIHCILFNAYLLFFARKTKSRLSLMSCLNIFDLNLSWISHRLVWLSEQTRLDFSWWVRPRLLWNYMNSFSVGLYLPHLISQFSSFFQLIKIKLLGKWKVLKFWVKSQSWNVLYQSVHDLGRPYRKHL